MNSLLFVLGGGAGFYATTFTRDSQVKHDYPYAMQAIFHSLGQLLRQSNRFYSGEDGSFRRQRRERTTVDEIIRTFSASSSDSISSSSLPSSSASSIPSDDVIVATFTYSCDYQLPANQRYVVYLTSAALTQFLTTINHDLQQPAVFGVLQKFAPLTSPRFISALLRALCLMKSSFLSPPGYLLIFPAHSLVATQFQTRVDQRMSARERRLTDPHGNPPHQLVIGTRCCESSGLLLPARWKLARTFTRSMIRRWPCFAGWPPSTARRVCADSLRYVLSLFLSYSFFAFPLSLLLSDFLSFWQSRSILMSRSFVWSCRGFPVYSCTLSCITVDDSQLIPPGSLVEKKNIQEVRFTIVKK